MFTGIIKERGVITAIAEQSTDRCLTINSESVWGDLQCGDSVAVNGTCLTITQLLTESSWQVNVSAETLHCTTFATLDTGDAVNLEPSLRFGDRLHGHLLSGHIDATGKILDIRPNGESQQFTISLPAELCRYVNRKATIAVDGVSLTVNDCHPHHFCVNIIPYTLSHTLFAHYKTGSMVNLEVDMIARYLESLLKERN